MLLSSLTWTAALDCIVKICQSSLHKLQLVQNAAAGIFTRNKKYHHITPVLVALQWLLILFRIDFEILLLTFKALNCIALT